MDRHQRLQRNLILLRLLRAASMAFFALPVLVLYYTAHGLSMEDVMLLQAIFAVTMVVIEVPSGYFSDVLGRRRTMIIGCTMVLIGWIVYTVAGSFFTFLVAEALLGVGFSFVSGTDSAMLYDTLLELGHTERSLREEGAQLSYGNFAEAGASIIGGALAVWSLHAPFILEAVWMVIPVVLAFMLIEPAEHRRSGQKAGWREIADILHLVVRRDRYLRGLIVSSAVISAATLIMVWMLQPYWTAVGIPVGWFGVLWASGNALVGVVSIRAHTIAERVSTPRLLAVLVVAVSASCAIAGVWPGILTAPLLAIMYVSRGLLTPIVNIAINGRVESGQRATVLSLRWLAMRFLFLITAPFVGRLADATSIPTALAVMGGGLAVVGSAALGLLVIDRGRDNGARIETDHNGV